MRFVIVSIVKTPYEAVVKVTSRLSGESVVFEFAFVDEFVQTSFSRCEGGLKRFVLKGLKRSHSL